jgi:precorrin-6B methylase 2
MNKEHIDWSIARAELGESKLPPDALNIVGWSSPKIKHFLNNICSLPDTNYLEIGCWQGSTFISALYGNNVNAVGIDNCSIFDGHGLFEINCKRFLNGGYTFINKDCFAVDLSTLPKFDVYFYDGGHTEEAQEKALTYFDPVLKDKCIIIIDDWNWPDVQNGTSKALQKLGYKIEHRVEFTNGGNDGSHWWNGLLILLINKVRDENG